MTTAEAAIVTRMLTDLLLPLSPEDLAQVTVKGRELAEYRDEERGPG